MTQPPPEYDTHETVVTETVTRPASALSPTTRLLLLTLGLLALAGLVWWLFQRSKPAEVVTNPPPVTTTAGTGTSTNPGSGGDIPPALPPSDQTGTSTSPETTVPGGGTPDPTAVTPKPEGINPDQPLAGLNGSNPFKPTTLSNNGNAGNGNANNGSQSSSNQDNSTPAGSMQAGNPDTTSAGPVTITRPRTPETDINNALTNPPASRPVTTTTRPPTSGSSVTQRPGTPTTAQRPQNSGSQNSGSQNSGSQNSSNQGSNSAGKPPAGNATPTAPVIPPVAGVAVPKSSDILAQGSNSRNPGAPVSGSGVSGSGTLPDPGLPPVLGSLGESASTTPTTPAQTTTSTTPTPTAPDTSAIDSYLNNNQVVLNAVVLGPTNTAILKTRQGFVVATVGQPITGSDIILKDVTTDSATLSVGNQTKTIPLQNKVTP